MKPRVVFGSILFLALAALPRAQAVPVTYTLTGYVQAVGSGQQVNTSFTWTVTADTGAITNPSAGHYQVPAASSTITFTGAGTTPLVGVSVSLNATTGQVTFGSPAGGIGLTSSQLQTWDLTSPIGPLNGANFLVAGTITTDTGTAITLSGVANPGGGPSPTFQAALPPPAITNVVNSASNLQPGLPNSAIAQGAIFTIFGAGLGPVNLVVAPAVFQSTNLSNTSVAVTVGGTTVSAPLYYTSASQVAALLPSNTPVGSGTLTVTYNGRPSAAAPIAVVASNAGIFTVGSNGEGPAVVTYADYSLVSPSKAANCGGPNTTCGAANPGDTLILWATGLGPVSGSDTAGAGLGQNMANLPLTVWLGGQQAPVVYQGRSGCCIGEDQIVFKVPDNVALGCAVPLLVQINNLVSNTAVMPVAKGGRTCAPNNPALAATDITAAPAATINFGYVRLSRDMNAGGQTYTDNARFQFFKVQQFPAGSQPFLGSYLDDPPPGACVVYNSLNPPSNFGLSVGIAAANAGPTYTIAGPNGSKVLAANPGQLDVSLSANGTYLSPGGYTISGNGGTDVGSFSISTTLPTPPLLTNPANGIIPQVTRSSGMTVNWSGGAANSIVQVQVSSATDNTFTNGAVAVCSAAASAGSMTIPGYVLSALPANFYTGFQLQQQTSGTFTAKGLDLAQFQLLNLASVAGGFTLK